MSLPILQVVDIPRSIATLSEEIALRASNLLAVKLVIEALRPLEGKTFTKHIANSVQKALPQYRVDWNTAYGMYHLDIRSGADSTNAHILIGHASSRYTTLDIPRVVESSQCYLLDTQRLPKMQALLHSGQFEKELHEYNEVVSKVSKIRSVLGDTQYCTSEE